MTLIDDLGLTLKPEKLVLTPNKNIVYLGFILCSITMTVRLSPKTYAQSCQSQNVLQLVLQLENSLNDWETCSYK